MFTDQRTQQASPGQPAVVGSAIPSCQQTLQAAFECSGVGLHSGATTRVRVCPTPANTGRIFVRTDIPDSPVIPANIAAVTQTLLSTELGQGDAQVRTVEHLLAALSSYGVENARIEIDGSELPLLDGSAKIWAEAIAQVGLVKQADAPVMRCGNLAVGNPITEPVWIHQGDAFVAALPSPELRFTYGIDFNLPAIGNQWHSWSPAQESFSEAIAPARTFALAHQIEQLRANGLIKGGSLDNALVCGPEGWINPPLRFSNEPARHKLLDLVGDLSLLGIFPIAHFLAYKASHRLHTQLAQLLAQRMEDEASGSHP